MGKKVDYFLSKQVFPTDDTCILVDLQARLVPAHLNGLSRFLVSSFWETENDWYQGYQLVLAEMEAILMPCGETIVNNLIALRGISVEAPRDPVTGVPLGDPTGTDLLSIYNTQVDRGETTAALLTAIRQQAEAIAQSTQEGLLDEGGVARLLTLISLI